jgi:ABC-type dipeptide/oligopeptide/nickel transport system permease subunit
MRTLLSLALFRKRPARVGATIVLAILALVLVGPFLVPYSPYSQSGPMDNPPNLAHPFGTDYLGQDILSEAVFGGYPSMIIGVIASIGAIGLGLLAGVLGGYFRKLEGVFIGAADVILTFSPLPLMLLLGSLFVVTDTLIVSILILVLWAPVARAIRSQVLSVKERPYVESAKLSGMSDFEIVRKVIIPEVLPIAFAYFVLTIAAAIVLTTALEFLGVGNPDVVSWGSMLYWAQQFAFYRGDWWWILAPGLLITLIATGFALIGFSVEEITNPRLRV